jgi:catechol 2,3-dioxygenase-like lactoylglutathione lyase family enzyme
VRVAPHLPGYVWDMLNTAALQAFVPVQDLDRATTFYRDTLGLRCDLSIPGLVSVFDAGGATIRVTLVPEYTPYPFTQIGWSVPDIESTVRALRDSGVIPLRYEGMTDERGIWTTPGGDHIAWFHDPDANVVSLTQHAHTATRLREIVPIFPVRSVDDALARYARLGFITNAFDSTYGFASRGAVNIHVSHAADWDPATSDCMAYLYVDDADALHAEWSGVEGRHHRPTDTPYGLREGAYIDPDGNLHRYGSPI